MFYEMRRKKQLLSAVESAEVLERGTSGVLALDGGNGYPYAVPLSFVYDEENGKLYFHCAKSGHKLDAIKNNEKASFCVIDRDEVVPGEYTTYFRSVIVFGSIRILTGEAEKLAAIEKLAVKYAPGESVVSRRAEINKDFSRLCMLEFQIAHMSGKQAIELVKH